MTDQGMIHGLKHVCSLSPTGDYATSSTASTVTAFLRPRHCRTFKQHTVSFHTFYALYYRCLLTIITAYLNVYLVTLKSNCLEYTEAFLEKEDTDCNQGKLLGDIGAKERDYGNEQRIKPVSSQSRGRQTVIGIESTSTNNQSLVSETQ
jgi:hypothetical protein